LLARHLKRLLEAVLTLLLAFCSDQQIAAHAQRPRLPEALGAACDGLERLFARRKPGSNVVGARIAVGERAVEATSEIAGQQLGVDSGESLNTTLQLDEPSPPLTTLASAQPRKIRPRAPYSARPSSSPMRMARSVQ